MLTEKQLAHFKQLLLSRQKELRSLLSISHEASETVELDQTRVGRLSRMDALQGQAMAQEMERRNQLELKRITAALQRIDEGEYGECVECLEDIDPRRLQVKPAVTLCIRCASASEQKKG